MSTGVIVTGALFAAVWLGGRLLARYEARQPNAYLKERDRPLE